MGWRAAVRVCKRNAFSHCGSKTVFFLFFTTVFGRALVISTEVARKQCFFYLFEAGGLSCPWGFCAREAELKRCVLTPAPGFSEVWYALQ